MAASACWQLRVGHRFRTTWTFWSASKLRSTATAALGTRRPAVRVKRSRLCRRLPRFLCGRSVVGQYGQPVALACVTCATELLWPAWTTAGPGRKSCLSATAFSVRPAGVRTGTRWQFLVSLQTFLASLDEHPGLLPHCEKETQRCSCFP